MSSRPTTRHGVQRSAGPDFSCTFTFRRSVYGLRGQVLIAWPRRAGDLPILVHVVSERARVLRLRRTVNPLAISVVDVLPSSTGTESAVCSIGFSKHCHQIDFSFTSAFKELDPIPQFRATAKLGEFLESRFSQSF